MKIYENLGPVLPANQKSTAKNVAQDNEFQKIMDQMQDETLKNTESPAAPPLTGVQIFPGAEKISQAASVKEMVLNELRNTLDLVDIYTEKLGNTSLPATGLSPLIEHLDERLKNLQNMESAKGMPDPLRPILNDVVVTLGTEIAKFRRGDYS